MKCSKCGKEIKNIYKLDGKVYGYNCYKMALAEKYKNYIDSKNLKYSLTAISAIEIYKDHKETSSWGKDFKDSILKQFNDCGKLTYKQLSCIVKRLNKDETVEYNILTAYMFKTNNLLEEYRQQCKDIEYYYSKNDIIEKFKTNELFLQAIKDSHKRHMNIYCEIDLDAEEKNNKHWYIVSDKKLNEAIEYSEEYKDIKIIEIIRL